MPLDDRDAASIWDMVQAIQRIQAFTTGVSSEAYLDSELIQSAVERQLEILGEAARRLSSESQQAHPGVDWAGIIGLRNVIAHRYDQIRAERIWSVLAADLPEILEKLEILLPPSEEPDNASE
ncbi:hypothetical protein C1752_01538 [Acaryochloris thomasi RCC1774]|uniref:DUF86 domain-containing protein n=1 Tax=Acaryochloris thomasi RCC1774 TaxID=1764569 RepID=A0A2W1JRW6_9CYAN|nr:HepT-like ribonuclease domain-containing protein [Acaryochloris thomasi]PZD73995.1 hypothetical protein C1752_01538 [Acaryochloris thomasi RCC1774]